MFEHSEVTQKEFTDNMKPNCVYESGFIVHEASVNNMVGYRRAIDNKNILCSTDISGRVSFSMLTDDLRIELFFKASQCHFNRITRVLPLTKSPFVATFSENESVKIWNTVEKYLSLVINQFRVNTDLDFCLCDNSKYLALANSQGAIEMHLLDYNNNSKNVFSQGVVVKKKIQDVQPLKIKIVLECANRIELPFMSVLVRETDSTGFSIHIIQIQTLETFAIKTGSIPQSISLGSMHMSILSLKNLKLLEHPDSWQEYYGETKVVIYDQYKCDLVFMAIPTTGGSTIEEDRRMVKIGNFMGVPVVHMDLSSSDYPHVMFLADSRLEYLCVYGKINFRAPGYFDEESETNRMVIDPSRPVTMLSKPKVAKKPSKSTVSVATSSKAKPPTNSSERSGSKSSKTGPKPSNPSSEARSSSKSKTNSKSKTSKTESSK